MVTAPAPALPDSHALPQAAVGAASTSSKSLSSFLSVYQSLPGQAGSSEDALLPQNSISKTPGGKKPSSKGTEDNLVAIVSPASIDLSPARPTASAHPSFSLTVRDHAAATESTTNQPAHTATQPVLPSGVKHVAKADIGSMIQSDAKAQIDAKSSIPGVPDLRSRMM